MRFDHYSITSTVLLLDFLSESFPETSKTTIRKWLKGGRIAVNGFWEDEASLVLQPGTQVRVYPQSKFLTQGVQELYSDRHLIVIYKPEKLLSVALDSKKLTLHAHGVVKRAFPKQQIFVIHRLDKGTSGVMLFCRSQEAYQKLKQLFFHHDLTREYIGIVQGKLTTSGKWEHVLWEDTRQNMQVCDNNNKGVDAITYYEPLGFYNGLSIVKFKLETGRKNQIRVQCAHEGFPIVGDIKYGSQMKFQRLCLHASDLLFQHPCLDKTLSFHLPLPKIFKRLVSPGFVYA